ncbi:hypothetical protein COCVIDRAFT_39961 [Bipolaris victoriae FI3]|uniref:Uncharacterized protein n=1 Tax=Bipolaris victoriae (strain FI3) TaxID=930091 RepID=W7E8G8_BIPV3|nr:hypothetical protein COCVIDRAFT_39961 [Bipolaris victoriae FI3]
MLEIRLLDHIDFGSWFSDWTDRVSTLETVGSIPLSGVDPIGRLPALSMLKRSIHTTLSGWGEAGRLWEGFNWPGVPRRGGRTVVMCVCEHEDHGPSHRGQASSVSTRAEALAIEWYAGAWTLRPPVVLKTTDKTDKTEQAVERVALPAGPVASARHTLATME